MIVTIEHEKIVNKSGIDIQDLIFTLAATPHYSKALDIHLWMLDVYIETPNSRMKDGVKIPIRTEVWSSMINAESAFNGRAVMDFGVSLQDAVTLALRDNLASMTLNEYRASEMEIVLAFKGTEDTLAGDFTLAELEKLRRAV